MLVGVTHDDVFGPIVVCGAGGTTAELLHDIATRVAPITDVAADEMVRSLATFPLLDGYRGAPPADVSALEDTLLRVSALASERESVMEMDCNPVMVRQKGAVVVDARVRVASRKRPRHPAQPVGLELHGGNRGFGRRRGDACAAMYRIARRAAIPGIQARSTSSNERPSMLGCSSSSVAHPNQPSLISRPQMKYAPRRSDQPACRVPPRNDLREDTEAEGQEDEDARSWSPEIHSMIDTSFHRHPPDRPRQRRTAAGPSPQGLSKPLAAIRPPIHHAAVALPCGASAGRS